VCLWALGVVVAFQIAVGILIDQRWKEVRDPEYALREDRLKERLHENPGKPLVLALGSSRTANGIHAERLSGTLSGEDVLVFNAGIPKSGPFLQQVYLERLRAESIRPDYLLLELMPAYLDERAANEMRLLDASRLDLQEMTQVGISLSTPWRRWTVSRLLPFSRFGAELHENWNLREDRAKRQESEALDTHGWRPVDHTAAERITRTQIAHSQYDVAYRDFKLGLEALRRFENLLSTARQDGIPTAVILLPEGTEFRDRTGPAMRNTLCELTEKFQREWGVKVIDARDWIEDAGFYDMHHLNPDGARAFTDRLTGVLYPSFIKPGRASARAAGR